MFQRPRKPCQIAIRVEESLLDMIDELARAAHTTRTEYARRAVEEKVKQRGNGDQHREKKLKVLEDLLVKLAEQVASLAYELRDFRERFDETVVTAEDDPES